MSKGLCNSTVQCRDVGGSDCQRCLGLLEDGGIDGDCTSTARRAVMLAFVFCSALGAVKRAEAEGEATKPPASPVPERSSTYALDGKELSKRLTAGPGAISTLEVTDYIQQLNKARRDSWPRIAQKISSGEYVTLSQMLIISPFEDVRQACLYIPFALQQRDDVLAAEACRKAYVDFIDHVHDLDRISLAASRSEADPNQVQQAFMLLSASLDTYIASIPSKYLSQRLVSLASMAFERSQAAVVESFATK